MKKETIKKGQTAQPQKNTDPNQNMELSNEALEGVSGGLRQINRPEEKK